MGRRLIKERHFKAGYNLITSEVSGAEAGNGPSFVLTHAETPEGAYIGTSRDAYRLCVKRGIRPEKANPTHDVCSIGFSARVQKWYGWSHRAIYGFGIGDVVKDGDCTAGSGWIPEYLVEHPDEDLSLPVGFTAWNLEEARKMAVAFASSVS